ncbi:MAG: hypothetical protein M1541_11465 [Acidobacteria bacterium]|nr:hypothetical protein [Acidobacteriota bacterium]
MKRSITLRRPWPAVLPRLLAALRDRGYQTRQTFDLQAARQSLGHGTDEPCPHHGTAPCNCQYLVIQAVGIDRSPLGVVVHGHDLTTTISFLAGDEEETRRDLEGAFHEAMRHLPHDRLAQTRSRNSQFDDRDNKPSAVAPGAAKGEQRHE